MSATMPSRLMPRYREIRTLPDEQQASVVAHLLATGRLGPMPGHAGGRAPTLTTLWCGHPPDQLYVDEFGVECCLACSHNTPDDTLYRSCP